MGNIYFDFNAVYNCAAKVRGIASNVEQEGKKITSLINMVEVGWTGAGSEAYINYLQSVQVNIFERSQKLYSIADALEGSAIAAEEADREAARQLAERLAAETAQSAGHVQQPAICPPPTDLYEPPQSQQVMPDEVANAANNMVGNIFGALKNASKGSAKSGRKR